MIDSNMTSLRKPLIRRQLFAACLSLSALATTLSPSAALAQEEEAPRDARLEGYDSKVYLDGESQALTYILLIALGGLTFGVMFKNARRTHLD